MDLITYTELCEVMQIADRQYFYWPA